MGKLAELSLQYFNTTSPEQLQADWEELKKYNEEGPDMMAVLTNYGRGCAMDVSYSCFTSDENISPVTPADLHHEYTDSKLYFAA